ncbi:MAG TPA: AAA family ATPase [Syntrophobacteraceae bacterium]|nr:AAA family ATPase [Syntrophobacteraceae bacterium]
MYTDFYHLKKCPFHITPDPEFLYLSPSHKQALGSVIYGVEERKGFIAIVGEVGVGKTAIIRSFLESVDEEKTKIIYTFNPKLSFEGVLKFISRELGIGDSKTGDFEMLEAIQSKLIEEYLEGRNVVLIVDEAQNMPVETLENLRMLSNLETPEDKLIQIVLVGQPELERTLERNELRQLRQRIAIYSTISPLTEAESIEYIKFRLSTAARVRTPIFTRGAALEIIRAAKGIPRSINIISDNALIMGYGAQRKPVTANMVREVIADLKRNGKPGFRLRWAVVLGAVAAILALMAWIWPPTLLNDAQTAVGLTLHRTKKPISPARNPSGGPAKPDPAAAAKGTADAGYAERDPPQQAIAPEELAPVSDMQASPAAHPANENGKVTPEKRPEGRPTPEVRVDMTSPGASWTDAGKGGPPPAVQQASLEADHAAAFPKSAAEMKPRGSQEAITIRTTRKGDSLIRIAAEVYGISVEEVCRRGLMDSVAPLNPQIHDINLIGIGEKIVFPPLK